MKNYELVMLGGDFDLPVDMHHPNTYLRNTNPYKYRRLRSRPRNDPPEFMEGIFGDFWTGLQKIATAPFKMIGHTVMEAGRGISRGDIGRILMAPVKGITHGVAEEGRGIALTGSVGGPILIAAGAIPTPLSPFLIAGGTAWGTTGAIYTGYKAEEEAKKRQAAGLPTVSDNTKIWLWGGAAVAAGLLLFS